MRPFALAWCLVLVVSACGGASAPGGPPGSPGGGGPGGKGPQKPVVVRTAVAREERVERVVELTGTLAGEEQVTVSAEVEGRVERVVKDLGDVVEAGGALVQLAAHAPRLQVAQADADYHTALARVGVDDAGLDSVDVDAASSVRRAVADHDEAKRQLARAVELSEKKVASQAELDAAKTREAIADAALAAARDDARANLATARARRATLGLAKKRLADTTIASPVAAVVAARLVGLGELVKAGQPIATVVATSRLKLRAEVPERYADVVVKGLSLDVVAGSNDAPARGVVSRVGPLVDAASRTFPIEALFENADGRLKPGTFARASVVTGVDEAVIAVPETAVASLAGVTKVYVVDDSDTPNKAAPRNVTVLRKQGSNALVAGELKAGERVITTAIARLFPGAAIEIDTSSTSTQPPPSPTETPQTPTSPSSTTPSTTPQKETK